MQHAAEDCQVGVRRDHVDVIRLDPHVVARLADRHARALREQAGEDAVVRRVQMLDQHVSHAEVRREMVEELVEGFEAAGRSADADDREHGGQHGRVAIVGVEVLFTHDWVPPRLPGERRQAGAGMLLKRGGHDSRCTRP